MDLNLQPFEGESVPLASKPLYTHTVSLVCITTMQNRYFESSILCIKTRDR